MIPLIESPGAEPMRTGTCGACTRCLDACPTDAFVGPFHLDPQRCISYWTIEARGPIPRALRSRFGNRIFGCDICQEVCPWNHRQPARTPLLDGLHARRERMAPPLLDGFRPETPYWLDGDAFAAQFRRSPVKRAKRPGMLRNVCVALGNWGDPSAIPALQQALADVDPLPRGHAAWALGEVARRHADTEIESILKERLACEPEKWVREDLGAALTVTRGE
jgi:epoxyqueuosine reductase